MAANNLTTQGINELWQQERDLMNYAWTTSEKALDREAELAKQNIAADARGNDALATAGGAFLSGIVKNVVFGK